MAVSSNALPVLQVVFEKYAAAPAATGAKPLQPQDQYDQFKAQSALFQPPKIPAPPKGPLNTPNVQPKPKPAEQLTKIQPNQPGATLSVAPNAPPSPAITVSGGSTGTVQPVNAGAPTTDGGPPPQAPSTPGGAWANVPPNAGPPRPGPGKFDNFAEDMIATGKQPAGAVIDMTQPVDTDFVSQQISDQKIPVEQRQQIAEMFVKDHLRQNPMLMEGLQDIQAGKADTEAARAFMAKLDAQKAAFIEAHPQEAATPQGFGQLMQQWEAMPFASKALMGVGLPLGLVGIMSSLFGKGGMGMGILGLLGLGAAGIGGAMGGMFGEGAQNMAGDAAFNLGKFTGMIPEKADLSPLMADDPMAAVGAGPIGTRETVKAQLAGHTQQLDQLKQLMAAPIPDAMKMQWLQKLDPRIDSPEMAQKVFQNAQNMVQQYGDANSPLQQKLQEGQNYANSTGMSGALQEYIGVPWKNWLEGRWKGASDMNVSKLIEKWADNKNTPCSCGCGDTVTTCKCSADCSCRKPGGSCYKAEKQASKPGLWANIHAKRKRGEKPAKPGDKDYPDTKSWNKTVKSSSSPAWQRSAGKNEEGGLNEKGRKSYERETGGNLKAPVTESNPKGDRAKRQNSFCSRMCGMKKHETGSKTKKDPDSRINKSLRKWNCKCAIDQAVKWAADLLPQSRPDDYLYTDPDYSTLAPEKQKAFDAFWTDNDGYAKIIAATRKLNKTRNPADVDPREIGAGYTTYANIDRLMRANALPVNEQFTLDDWRQLYNPPVKKAFNDVDAKELADLKAEQSKKYDLDNARRLHELEKRQQVSTPAPKAKTIVVVACQKAARCWAGYEPVPGAKAYSRGSCRPKGSKKTQKEMKKQSTSIMEGTRYGKTHSLVQGSEPG